MSFTYRAYQAVNRVCVGKAKRVRFRSKGRGINSVEGKRNDVGPRFVVDPNAGNGGFLESLMDRFCAEMRADTALFESALSPRSRFSLNLLPIPFYK